MGICKLFTPNLELMGIFNGFWRRNSFNMTTKLRIAKKFQVNKKVQEFINILKG